MGDSLEIKSRTPNSANNTIHGVLTHSEHQNSVCVTGAPLLNENLCTVGGWRRDQRGSPQNHSKSETFGANFLEDYNSRQASSERIRTVAHDHQGPIRDTELTPETGLLATCSNDGTVKLRSDRYCRVHRDAGLSPCC
jgi:hypothetical protein